MHDKSNENTSFQLKGQSKEFAARKNDLFGQLDVLEKNSLSRLVTAQPPLENEQTYLVSSRRSSRAETKSLRGKESIFKRPEAPISKCLPVGRLPDFRKNPHNWTKYTLDDVKDEHMSERSNTAAAMSFLKELEERRQSHVDMDVEETSSSKRIVFNKKALIKDAETEEAGAERSDENKVVFRSSKVVMPEYVIGQKIKKNKRNKEKKNCNVSKQLKLDHLSEIDDEVE